MTRRRARKRPSVAEIQMQLLGPIRHVSAPAADAVFDARQVRPIKDEVE